ncbi:hypothetical protein [Piscinibacter sp. HJYY11]|uniref:hypothetical protein n=1 Tax=Piscinibacter sp. HJYY11 TaxID=2801333 RepID=UPI00191E2094|nr:hypothetical protein [Piscinibacter sp. HJYY11]MBL0726495.1 hypothetical protein [Piscinibacter sp. HJYY11]
MKQLRFWLLVVLVALLPIRGAMAAAMVCGPAGVGSQIEQPLMSPDHGGHHDHHHERGAEAHGTHHGHDQGQGGDASQDNKCTMCSAFCSATPLLSALPGLPAPLPTGGTHFPTLDAPAPTFLSDGQERPPRSI